MTGTDSGDRQAVIQAKMDIHVSTTNLRIFVLGVVVMVAVLVTLVATSAAILPIVMSVVALGVMIAGCVVHSRNRQRQTHRLAELNGPQ